MSKTERTTVMLGGLGGMLALMLFALALATRGSQGLFQVNRPAADYAALLVAAAPTCGPTSASISFSSSSIPPSLCRSRWS